MARDNGEELEAPFRKLMTQLGATFQISSTSPNPNTHSFSNDTSHDRDHCVQVAREMGWRTARLRRALRHTTCAAQTGKRPHQNTPLTTEKQGSVRTTSALRQSFRSLAGDEKAENHTDTSAFSKSSRTTCAAQTGKTPSKAH